MRTVLLIPPKSIVYFKEVKNMGNIFNNSWINISEIIIYGLGMVGKKYFDILKNDFTIKYIVDNSPNIPDSFEDVKVISLDKLLEVRDGEKIVVLASKEAFISIKRGLDINNLTEYEDYVRFDDFVSDWYWQVKNKNCIREVHTAINTNCTFNCEKCNMFIPYYKNVTMYTLEEIKKSLELFFPLVDFVFVFSYLGGEPFLNHELKYILSYTYENYHTQIGRIEIVSNGSIIPDAETLEVMYRYHVLVRISDYTENVDYHKRLEQFIHVLEQYKIAYSVEKSLEWVDFCFPSKDVESKLPIKDVRAHMLCCSPAFHGLNDGKFYYCHVAWSAEKAGLITLKKGDYITLDTLDYSSKDECRTIVEYANGNVADGYISLCEKCMGCGPDNNKFTPTGVQLRKE